eukprot:jgi/Bigna1/90937/estExt_fgenesh1_pg.C_830049
MARPFSKLKGTNIEDLAEKVVEKLEGGGGGSKAKACVIHTGVAPEKKSTKKTKESKSKTASQKSSKATAKAATKAAAKKAPAAKRKAPAPTVGVRRSSRIRTQNYFNPGMVSEYDVLTSAVKPPLLAGATAHTLSRNSDSSVEAASRAGH